MLAGTAVSLVTVAATVAQFVPKSRSWFYVASFLPVSVMTVVKFHSVGDEIQYIFASK